MGIRQRGSSWQADFTVNGTRCRRDFDTKDEAVAWEAEERLKLIKGDRPAKVIAGPAEKTTDNYTLDMLVTVTYQMEWAGTKNEKDALRNANDVGHTLAVVILGRDDAKASEVRPVQITEGVIDGMVARFKERGNSDSTINRKLSALSVMLRAAKRRGCFGSKEAPEIKWRSEEGTERVRYFSKAEEASILDWFERQEKRHMADLITFLLDCGTRLSEALAVTWRDVEALGAGEPVRVWHKPRKGAKGTKNGQSRSTYQSIRVADMLTRRKAACPIGEARVFWDIANVHYVENWWTKMRAGVGAKDEQDFVVHACRHTWASRCAMQGVPMPTIKQIGGWKTEKMLHRYAHIGDASAATEMMKLNTFADRS